MQRYANWFRDNEGRGYPGAVVSVFNAGLPTLATIYSAQGSLNAPPQIANPTTTDPNGFFQFAVPNGVYDIQIQAGGMPTVNIPNWTAQDNTPVAGPFPASNVTYVPHGTVTSVNVQAALDELQDDLAGTGAGQGAAMLGYLAPFTGAVATTQDKINLESVSIFRWFTAAQIADWRSGALAVNVTLAIQSALDNCPLSSILIFPPGKGRISEQGGVGYILRVSRPVRIQGAGAHYCALVPVAGTSVTCDIIQIYPSTSYACDLLTMDGVFIGDPSTGTCAGRHTVYVLTAVTGQYLPKLTITNCSCGTSANGDSFRHIHTSPDPQGGVWTALIENNQFRSGMYLSGSGDSNVIRNNVISGTGIGIYVSLVSGASCLSIEDNNITSSGGAIKADYASRVSIRHNNIECAGAGSNGAVIDINGAGAISYGGSIRDNLISGQTGCTLTMGVRVKNAYGLHIEDNVFLGVSAMNVGITAVDASVNDLRIGANTYNAAITTKISDSGQGTCGAVKVPTLLASWVARDAANYVPIEIRKSSDGVVQLQMEVKSGTSTTGTTMFTIPVGSRPSKIIDVPAVYYTAGIETGCCGRAYPSGEFTIQSGNGTVWWACAASWLAAAGSDGVSGE